MAGGTINGTTGNQYIDSKIVWSSVANADTNSSTVTAALYYKRNNTGFTTSGTGSFSITIAGVKKSASKVMSITGSAWALAMEATVTVTHDTDGGKNITISAAGSMPSTTLSSTSCSDTVSLDTIPRASSITSAGAVTLGKACAVKWTPLSKAFRYKLKFVLGDWNYTTGAIHPNITSAYTYDDYPIPLTVANQLPKAKMGTMTVYLYTYSDSGATKQVGSASSKTFTVTVPSNTSTNPDVTMSLSPVTTLGSPFSSLYIQGFAKVKASFLGEGKYNADISSYKMTVQGKSYASPYQSDYLSQAGTVTVTGRGTDTRGYYTDVPKDITVIPYAKPEILPASGTAAIVCARCDSTGKLTASGTYLKIKARRSYSKVISGGVQKNFCEIRYRYRAESAASFSSWVTLLARDNVATDMIDHAPIANIVSSVKTTYVVEIGVVDDIGKAASVKMVVPTDTVTVHLRRGGKAIGIGKYAEEDGVVDIAEDLTLRVRGKLEVLGGEWISLGLSSAVSESTTNTGRSGKGCFYRVENGNHVFVAFNCAATYAGAPITVSASAIPAQYRPSLNAYALCTTNGRGVARVFVNTSGEVRIDFVQNMASAENTTSITMNWVDGYIDYFV